MNQPRLGSSRGVRADGIFPLQAAAENSFSRQNRIAARPPGLDGFTERALNSGCPEESGAPAVLASTAALPATVLQSSTKTRFKDLDWRVRSIMEWVEERSGHIGLTLKELGARLGASERHLGRLFTRQAKGPFRRYLREVRMQAAAIMLENPVVSIKDIAARLGYSEVNNFHHDFRAFYCISPARYRKQASDPCSCSSEAVAKRPVPDTLDAHVREMA